MNKIKDSKIKDSKKLEADDDEIIIVNKIKTFSDGKHEGTISDFKRNPNREGYDYCDIFIDTLADDGEIGTLKVGFPTNVSRASHLGRFLMKGGMNLDVDSFTVNDICTHMKGKKVVFNTFTEETDKGEFSRVIAESIKFL